MDWHLERSKSCASGRRPVRLKLGVISSKLASGLLTENAEVEEAVVRDTYLHKLRALMVAYALAGALPGWSVGYLYKEQTVRANGGVRRGSFGHHPVAILFQSPSRHRVLGAR